MAHVNTSHLIACSDLDRVMIDAHCDYDLPYDADKFFAGIAAANSALMQANIITFEQYDSCWENAEVLGRYLTAAKIETRRAKRNRR